MCDVSVLPSCCMMLLAGFAGIFLFALSVEGECTEGCDVPMKHYEEIGCTAVYANPTDCCPTHFDCTQFQSRALNKCYYKGKEYNMQERIPNEELSGGCIAACTCEKLYRQDFICAHIDCAEFFHSSLQRGCIRQYDLKACCAKATVCPPFDKLGTCVLEGKTFYEGQRMYPSDDDCKTCICKPEMDKPYCRPVSCAIELYNTDDIRSNCAPVYYGNEKCCPIRWQCASETDKILPAATPNDSGKKCKYGDKELGIGDKVTGSNHLISCECKMPPLLTCKQTPVET